MKCSWCETRKAEFKLSINFLEERKQSASNSRDGTISYVRGPLYLQVNLCEKCLPCTATTNVHRTKLRG